MPIPVAQAGADQSFAYSASPVGVTLAGAATNTPITAWKWTMLSVPSGSSANVGTNQDFSSGESTLQNPDFDMDVPGCYVLQLEAQNATGWSDPESDKEGAQTLCFMRTQKFDLEVPGYKAYRYDPYLNGTVLDLETGLASHASRHQNGGDDEMSVAGLNGTLADPQTPTSHASSHENGGGDEISVAGLSGALADPQTPATHASSHQNGGADEVATATPGANAIPKASAGGKLDSWISSTASGTPGLIQLDGDLGGTAASPTVDGSVAMLSHPTSPTDS